MEHQSHPSPVSMTSNTSGLTLPGSNGSSPLTSNAIMTHSSDTLTAVNGIAQAELLSRKRSSAEQSQEGASPIEPNSKRRRVDEPVKPRTPSPTPEPMVLAEAFTTPLYDDAPKYLLQRTCALALNHVGFDSATKEAMESFSAQIDTYMTKILSHVMESMLAARRTFAIPTDFEFSMRHMGLTSSHLKPHLKQPVSRSKTQLSFSFAEEEASLPQTPVALLGEELSGASDKESKNYIPTSFPAFPSKHTYKSTAVLTKRENDQRKIREKATEGARNAEEALRRLVKFAKIGGNGAKRGLENNERKKTRNDLWEKAMAGFATESPPGVENEEQSIAVDASKQFWRKPVARGRGQAVNTSVNGQQK